MCKGLRIGIVGLVLLIAACSGDDDDTSAGIGGTSLVGETTGSVTGLGGAGGTTAGSGGATLAGSGGAKPTGSGGGVAGSGGAGSGGAKSGGGGATAGSSGAVAGSSGAIAGTNGAGGTGGMTTNKPPCLTNPDQVAMLGDSYVAAPSFIGPAIVEAAIADGALQAGQSYKDYSVPGTLMLNGQIPGQMDQALADNPDLQTIITDGGGNDIIGSVVCLADGSTQNPDCVKIVTDIVDMMQDMAAKAKAAGVTDIIYFLYPDNVPIGGAEILSYAVEEGEKLVQELMAPDFRVYLVDTRPIMKDHPDWYVDLLIHVNADGAKLIAEEIYRVMKTHCIAQPPSSGCCAP
jgi:hypothetical protein